MTDTAALLARIEQLERRAQAAEDYRDLVNLQGAYGYYVDKGLWDQAADLFAEDGTLEIAGRGVYVGRERVREYLRHLPPYGHGTIYNHMQLQPVLHIDSEAGTAKGRWRTLMMVGLPRQGRPLGRGDLRERVCARGRALAHRQAARGHQLLLRVRRRLAPRRGASCCARSKASRPTGRRASTTKPTRSR